MRKMIRRGLSGLSRRTRYFRGKGRILWALDGLLGAESTPIRRRLDGVEFILNTRDLIDFQKAYFGAFDQDVITALAARINSGSPVLWDIGANVGSICLPLLSRHPNLRACAFEASPPVLSRLIANASVNPSLAGRLEIFAVAMSDQASLVDFFTSNEPHNSGLGAIGQRSNTMALPVKIPAMSGDEIIESGLAPPPDLIKIDVEGHESAVFAGLRRYISRSHPAIAYEHSTYRLREIGEDPMRVADYLQELGYSLSILDSEGELTPLDRGKLEQDVNLNLLALLEPKSK